MRISMKAAVSVVLGLAIGACGGGGGGTGTGGAFACMPGQTRICTGPGACQGGQTCASDGSWGPCDCGTGGGSMTGTTASGGIGGTGGGATCSPCLTALATNDSTNCDVAAMRLAQQAGQPQSMPCGTIYDCDDCTKHIDCGICNDPQGCGLKAPPDEAGAPGILIDGVPGLCGGGCTRQQVNDVRCETWSNNGVPYHLYYCSVPEVAFSPNGPSDLCEALPDDPAQGVTPAKGSYTHTWCCP